MEIITDAMIDAAARVFCNGLPLDSHPTAQTVEGLIAKGRCWAPACPCWEQGRKVTRAALQVAILRLPIPLPAGATLGK